MRDRPQKALLIGIDAAVMRRWRRFVEAGELPVGRRLLDEGCLATNCLPAMPTLTTTNWATIATGAWPGTHGIVDFNPRRPGDGFEDSVQAFDARDLRAETVWDAAARGGRSALVVNYPASWPPKGTDLAGRGGETPGGRCPQGAPPPGQLVMIGGAGIEFDEWRIGLEGKANRVALAAEQRFCAADEPLATRVEAPRPGGAPVLCRFTYRNAYEPVETDFALACRVDVDQGRPRASFTVRGEDAPAAGLAPGQWSDTIRRPFRVGGQDVTGAFRLKLLELDADAGRFRLYVTDLCRLRWLEHPDGALGDISGFGGFPTPGVGWDSVRTGCLDLDTFVELTAMATEWLGDACVQLLRTHEWDLFCTHFHAVDSFYHLLSQGLDPAQARDPAERARHEAAEIAVYRGIDTAVGRILDAVDVPAFTVLISDHGAKPTTRMIPVAAILEDAGLLARRADGTVDSGRTQAAPYGSCFVSVNVQGRDPKGVVAPSAAASVREQALAALQSYRDPETGLCPFTVVLRKEDARVLGLYGDGVGDVVYAVREEFSDVHGQVLSTGEWAGGSLRSLAVFSGAGVRRGVVLKRPVALVDVVPTLCHATGLPLPREAEGAVIHQALDEEG